MGNRLLTHAVYMAVDTRLQSVFLSIVVFGLSHQFA